MEPLDPPTPPSQSPDAQDDNPWSRPLNPGNFETDAANATDNAANGSRDEVVSERLAPGVTPVLPADPQWANPYLPASGTALAAPLSGNVGPRLRSWPSFLVIPISFLVFVGASVVMLLVAVFAVVPGVTLQSLRDPETIRSVSESRLGLFLLMVPAQMAMVSPALIAAFFSPVAFRKRLGLVRGGWPIWAWVGAALATPLIGMISGLVFGQFVEESEQLKEMSGIFREHGKSGFLIPIALMVGLTPAICEEFLFRGFVQTRLAKTLPPMLGIGIASLCFAAFHMDPVHVLVVFPLGFFLGFVAWKSGSIYPAVLGHFVNNALSVVLVTFAPENETDALGLPGVIASLSILSLGMLGLASVVLASIRYNRSTEVPAVQVA